jgi:hypothetical protein
MKSWIAFLVLCGSLPLDIAAGAYGLTTYRTAISSSRFYAGQP